MEILISNIKEPMPVEVIEELFAFFGNVSAVKMMDEAAIVIMPNRDDAEFAIEELNGRQIHGNIVKLEENTNPVEYSQEENKQEDIIRKLVKENEELHKENEMLRNALKPKYAVYKGERFVDTDLLELEEPLQKFCRHYKVCLVSMNNILTINQMMEHRGVGKIKVSKLRKAYRAYCEKNGILEG